MIGHVTLIYRKIFIGVAIVDILIPCLVVESEFIISLVTGWNNCYKCRLLHLSKIDHA